MISSTHAKKLLTGKDDGSSLEGGGRILGISGLKSLITKEDMGEQTMQFFIPGNSTIGNGITAELF